MVDKKKTDVIIYDGKVPQDIQIGNIQGPGAFAFVAAAAAYVGTAVKFALLAYSLYSTFNRPKLGKVRSAEIERGFGFSQNNAVNPDAPLAIIYGEHLFAPQYFYTKLSNFGDNNRLDLGLGIGEGPIDSISQLKVNDILFENLSGNNSYDFHNGSSVVVDERLDKLVVSTDYNDEVPEGDQNGIVRTGASLEMTAFDIGIVFPEGLFSISNSDGIKPFSSRLIVNYRAVGSGTWLPAINEKISGQHRGELRKVFQGPRGLTPDQYEFQIIDPTTAGGGFNITDGFSLDFINEYVSEDWAGVTNFAYLGLTLEATSTIQGGFPAVTALVKGRKVDVYTADDPLPGQFSKVNQWSDNPAWCLLDYLLNKTYGVGKFISISDVDLRSFCEVADYLDEIDSNGARRGRIDLVISQVVAAVDVIESILNTFGGILRLTGDRISLVVIKDEASVQAFNKTNMISGSLKFEVADPNESTRINRLNLSFFNRGNNFNRDTLRVQVDSEISSEDDVIEDSIDLFGVTRQLEVEALGRIILNTKRTNVILAEWKSDISTIQAQVGDVVTITHDLGGFSNKKFRIIEIQEGMDQLRTIRALEHNASVFDEEVTGTTPNIETTLWNPLTTASPIEDFTLAVQHVTLPDGSIRTDLCSFWTTATGSVDFYGIREYDIYSAVSDTIELPSGTLYNSGDTDSMFFITTSGTVISGARNQPFRFEGAAYPPDTSYCIRNIDPTDFYNVAIVAVTNNLVSQDIANAVTAQQYVTTYSGQPNNTASFSGVFAANGSIDLFWTPVSLADTPDLAGYEVRNENANFGVSDAGLFFRGNARNFIIQPQFVAARSYTFYIKSFNTSGLYSSTSRSTTVSNTAPVAVTQGTPVVLGKSVRINWTGSVETDVVSYTVHVSSTNGFTPNSSNLVAELVGREISSFNYVETDGAFPTRYVKIGVLDALSKSLNDINYSSQQSFTASAEVAVADLATTNFINDSDFNGISPGYWTSTGSSSLSSSKGHVASNGRLSQTIPFFDRKIKTSAMNLSIYADTATTANGNLQVVLSGSNSYVKTLTIPSGSISSTQTRFNSTFSVDTPTTDVQVFITTAGSNTINVDQIQLTTGSGVPLQWTPSAIEIINGVTQWVGQTELRDDSVTSAKIVANTIVGGDIAAGTITGNNIAAQTISGSLIAANTITAELYRELRQTLYFRFQGELDASNPLVVIFHVPSELPSAADIVEVTLSYVKQKFRARSTSVTAANNSQIVPTTSSVGAGTHKHLLTSVAGTIINGTPLVYYKASTGLWGHHSSGTQTITLASAGSPSHTHTWTLVGHNAAYILGTDARLTVLNGKIGYSGGGDTIPTPIIINATNGHTHQISLGFLNSATEVRVQNGTTLATPNGTGNASIESNEGPDQHSHSVTIPAHTHATTLNYGIFEESNTNENDGGVTIAVRRADNAGTSFEGSAFSSSSNKLNNEISATSFYQAGVGAGFKAMRFDASGGTAGSRVTVNGMIMVKCDIDA